MFIFEPRLAPVSQLHLHQLRMLIRLRTAILGSRPIYRATNTPLFVPARRDSIRSFTSTHVDLDFEVFSGPIAQADSSTRTREAATHGPLVICHGLFGSKQNWRSLCKILAKNLDRPVYALDLRNHGSSPHSDHMDYASMAGDVLQFCEKKSLSDISLLGHSMGGKVVMAFALNPNLPEGLLSRLIVADVSPAKGPISDEFRTYVKAMQEIELKEAKSRKQADEILESYESDLSVRQFLLTNLVAGSSPQKFKIPLKTLEKAIDGIGDFPYEVGQRSWEGKTLFIKGAKSKYINNRNIPIAEKYFPNMKLEVLDAGHWVHAERPREFVKLVTDFTLSP